MIKSNGPSDSLYVRYFELLVFISALILFSAHALVFIAWPGKEVADKATYILVLLLAALLCVIGRRIEKLDREYFFSPTINIFLTILFISFLGSKIFFLDTWILLYGGGTDGKWQF